MLRISNEALVLETIRRTRYKVKRRDGTSVEGCRPSSVFYKLKGLMNTEEKRLTFTTLLADDTIVLGFSRYKRSVGSGHQPALETMYGRLHTLHPKAPMKDGLVRFYTTTRGRYLPRDTLGRLILPTDLKYYYEFSWSDMFIVADGLPPDFPTESVATWK